MTLIDFILLLIVAGIVGSIGQAIAGVSRGGCILAIVIGFIGALVGLWLKRLLALPEPFLLDIGGTQFPLLWSIIGSALFVAVIAFFTRRRSA